MRKGFTMTIKITCNIILFIYLLIMSVYDIRKREIHIGISIATAVVLAAVQIYRIVSGQMVWYLVFTGMIEGVLLAGLSVVTHGQIGIGDAIVFIIMGMLLDFWENGVLLLFSLAFAAAAGVLLLLLRHIGRKDKIPFVPFVFAGYGVMCVWRILG